MANMMIPQMADFINRQIQFQETLDTYLIQADSLVNVAIEYFFESGNDLSFGYLLALSDIITRAKNQNKRALTRLLNNRILDI